MKETLYLCQKIFNKQKTREGNEEQRKMNFILPSGGHWTQTVIEEKRQENKLDEIINIFFLFFYLY